MEKHSLPQLESLIIPIVYTGWWKNHSSSERGFVYSTFIMVSDGTGLDFNSYIVIQNDTLKKSTIYHKHQTPETFKLE